MKYDLKRQIRRPELQNNRFYNSEEGFIRRNCLAMGRRVMSRRLLFPERRNQCENAPPTKIPHCLVLFLFVLLHILSVVDSFKRRLDESNPKAAEEARSKEVDEHRQLTVGDNLAESMNSQPNEPGSNVRRDLPQPFQNGGIIYYLHIPKSGGSTVREFLSSRSSLKVARKRNEYKQMVMEIDQLLRNGTNGKIHAFESHSSNIPPYVQISPKVREWKAVAAAKDVPFFTFTLLRDPISYQISSFNYYYLGRRRRLANDTVQDFIDTLQIDPQCDFLVHGGGFTSMLDGYIRNNFALKDVNGRINNHDCDTAYQTLFQDMDWIGSTAGMQTQTLPLLNYLTLSRGLPQHVNQSPKYMT